MGDELMLQESIRLNPGGGFYRTNDLVSLIRAGGGNKCRGKENEKLPIKRETHQTMAVGT